jgi:hypothetical protein
MNALPIVAVGSILLVSAASIYDQRSFKEASILPFLFIFIAPITLTIGFTAWSGISVLIGVAVVAASLFAFWTGATGRALAATTTVAAVALPLVIAGAALS